MLCRYLFFASFDSLRGGQTTYRSKGARAQEIADDVVASEQQVLLLQADITDPDDVTVMFARIKAVWKKLDFLILNAKWGPQTS